MLRRPLLSRRIRRINNCLSFSGVDDSWLLGRKFRTSLTRANTRINDGDLIAEDVRLLMRRVTQPGTFVSFVTN